METGNKELLVIHNVPAPYRLPLFEKLNDEYDMEVYFCEEGKEGRKWSPDLEDYTFEYKMLRGFDIGNFLINFTLIFNLLLKKYDVYIVGENPRNFFATLITAIFSALFNKPFILWTEVIETEYSKKKRSENLRSLLYYKFINFYRNILYAYSTAIIAYSQKAEEFLIEKGIPRKKIFSGIQVMPEKLIPKTPQDTSELEFNDKTVVLYLGYLKERKGIQGLIEAYKKLDIKDSSSLVIVGDGSYREKLELQAKDENDIYFVEYVDEKKKGGYYSIADIFVLPTLHDPWGLVINEATNYGLPIITTSAAGASELVGECENGIIIEPNDKEELKEALSELIQNKELRSKMKENSENSKIHCDLDRGVEPFIEAMEFSIEKSES